MAQLEEYDHDAHLVVLRDASVAIIERPGFNVFAHVDRRWLIPTARTPGGIIRCSVIELALKPGNRGKGRLTAYDLRRAAELLITSTACEIMPVTGWRYYARIRVLTAGTFRR